MRVQSSAELLFNPPALLLLLLQELVGIMAASKGLVLMAPPSGNTDAQKTLAALLSAIKPKTKVGDMLHMMSGCAAVCS
jgi:hypothetical protein